MKKFLTMLLALSVVFTYTFGAAGSVFAATTDEGNYAYRVAEAEKLVQADLTSAYNYVVGSQLEADTVTATGGSINVAAENTKVAVDEAYKALQEKVKATAEAYKGYEVETYTAVPAASITVGSTDVDSYYVLADGVYSQASGKAVEGKTYYTKHAAYGNSTIAQIKSAMKSDTPVDAAAIKSAAYSETTFDAYKAKAQAEADKAKALDIIAKIDLSMYGTSAIANDGYVTIKDVKYYNYNAAAQAVVAGYKTALEELTVPAITSGNSSTVISAAKTLYDACAADGALVQEQVDENSVKTGKYEIKTTTEKLFKVVAATGAIDNSTGTVEILTIDKVNADEKANSANKASNKAKLASDVANFLKDTAYLNATKANQEKYDDFIKAYETAWTYRIDVDKADYTLRSLAVADYNQNVAANVAVAEKAIAAVPALKVAKDADGKIAYNAEKLDANLAKLLTYLYTNLTSSAPTYADTLLTAANATYGTVKAEMDYVSDFTKAEEKAKMAEKFDVDNMNQTYTATAPGKTYYAKEWAEVEAALATFNAAVDAAETDTAITTAKTDLTNALAVAKIKDTVAVNKLFETGAKCGNAAKTQAAALIAYANTLTTSAGKTVDEARDVSDYDHESEWKVYFAEQGARTPEEVNALYNTAVAMLNALPTGKETKDAKAAIEATIAALPTSATVADKATVKAAYEAYVAYKEKFTTEPSNLNTLKLVIYSVGKLEKDAAEKLQAEVAKIKVLAISDKAQVKAAADAINEYNADLKSGKMYTISSSTLKPIAGATTYTEKIRAMELKAVQDAIAALPTNVTEADKATVEAARAAYDAFVAEYEVVATDATKYNAKDKVGSITKLTNAEATLATIAELTKYTDKDAKADLLDMARKVTIWRTSKTSIKVTAVGSVKNIKDNGYTVKYTFYKKAPGAKAYKAIKTTTSNKYTYTNLKKGTNKFQVKVKVYDAEGKLVASKMTYYRAAKVK